MSTGRKSLSKDIIKSFGIVVYTNTELFFNVITIIFRSSYMCVTFGTLYIRSSRMISNKMLVKNCVWTGEKGFSCNSENKDKTIIGETNGKVGVLVVMSIGCVLLLMDSCK